MKLEEIPLDGYDTLLLDRDGTINVHITDGYVCQWEDFEFIPGVLEALGRFNRHFRHVFIVTNQRGVGRGVMSEHQLADIHDKMLSVIRSNGGRIDRIYYCTAVNDDDERRKPNLGMFNDILRDFPDVNPAKCLMVGDGSVDMEFARRCNIDGIQVDSVKRTAQGESYTQNGTLRIYRKLQ